MAGFLGRCAFWATVAAAGLAATSPVSAETRALLVGVWQFHSAEIPDLKGPANDLGAMEDLVRAKGATDVTVLRNDAVTRTAFETALHALGLRSKPGDTILIYYSGHGAEAQAAVKGTPDGDLDQFLPLAGFDLDHQDAERFIVDKDLYSWVARYVPRTVTVFMMADACHSGTLHRSIDPAAFHFTPRLAFRGGTRGIALVGRPAPRFAAVLAADGDGSDPAAKRADLPNEIYIGAALDDQLALEASLPAEGAPSRGLLTYAFEQALTAPGADGSHLAADLDLDGRVTIGELSTYLNAQVRMLTAQRQESSAHYPTSLDRVALFEEVAHGAAPVAAPPPRALVQSAVFVAGGAPAALGGIPAAKPAASADVADFVWTPATGMVVRRSGDQVAADVTGAAALGGVIEKWAAVEALRPLIAESSAKLALGSGRADERRRAGEVVQLKLVQPLPVAAARYATVFDVAADGTVQLLYPLANDGDGVLAPGATLPVLETQVVAPFGADHVVALVTPTPPGALRQLLHATDGQRGAGRLVMPIKAALADAHGAGALSVAELYTGR